MTTVHLLFRSQPRRVCTLLANGVAIFCDRNCQHGDYDTRGEPVQGDEENILMFSPDLSVREAVPYGSQFARSHSQLPLNKMDGSPLNLMGTVPSARNKVYRYQHSGGEVERVRRDRPYY